MKVLMWVPLPPPYAGPEVASQQLAEACRELLDVRIESATLRTSNATKGRIDRAGVAAFARAYTRFVRAARTSDVVYLVVAANRVGSLRDAILIFTARALGTRVVLHLRGGRYGEHYEQSSAAVRGVLRRAWGSATLAIVQAEVLRDQLHAAAPHVPVEVLPNGLRGRDHAPKSYMTSTLRILFVGHLAYTKGFVHLVRAFQILRESHPHAVLVCAGEIVDDGAFAELLPIARRGEVRPGQIRAALAEPGVEHAGVVSGAAKHALFASADVFVMPSFTEGFSLAILEAMFHGLPVISTRVGAASEVIADDQGILVAPGDAAALATALLHLARDPALREAMGRRNAKVARERYELDDVAKRLATLLDR